MGKEPKLILATIKNMLNDMELSRKREESDFGVLKKYVRDLETSMKKDDAA